MSGYVAKAERGGRPGLFAAYDFANDRLAVGRPASNVVTLMTTARIFRSGFAEHLFPKNSADRGRR